MICLLLNGCKHGEGMTPLLIAAHNGKISDVESLIASGVDVNQTSIHGWTSLIYAARRGHDDVVEVLLAAGGDPNVVTDKIAPGSMATRGGYFKTTALAESISNGHLGVAHRLIDNGAVIDSLSVALAGKAGDIELLTRLVDGGADLNRYSQNEFHPSALCESAETGNLEVVRWLHENGAQINIVLGRSLPLKSAIQSKQLDIVLYFLENGANPNLHFGDPGYHHNTLLGTAVSLRPVDQEESDKILKIINLLVEHGADVSHTNHAGETNLDLVLIRRNNQQKHSEQSNIHADNTDRVLIFENHQEEVMQLLKGMLGL